MTASAVSDATFESEVLQSTEPVLVDFFAEWCGPCKAMAPALDQVAAERRAQLKVVKLDVDQNPAVKEKYAIRGMPTLILFRDGKPVGKHMGSLPVKAKLEAQIDALLAVASATGAVEPRATKFKLANGMDVVVIPDHRAPAVTHMIFYRVGNADAPASFSGVATLLEHLMLKFCEESAVGEFAKVYPTHDVTAYHRRIAKDQLKSLMQMEARRMTQLRPTDDEVAAERQVVIEGHAHGGPSVLLSNEMKVALYGAHPYGNPLYGRANDLANLSGADVMRFYQRYYAPNNAVLVVAGDVTPEGVARLAEETYGQIPAGLEVGERSRPPLPLDVAVPRITVKDERVRNPEFWRTYCVASYVTAKPGEAQALELLAQILRDSKTGRPHRQLAEGKLVPRIRCDYSGSATDSGAMYIAVLGQTTGDLQAVEDGVDAVLDDIRANGVSEPELQRAKQALTPPKDIYRVDNNEVLAERYGTALAIGRSLEELEDWPAALAKVTTEDIKRVANVYLDRRRSVTGWLLPEVNDVARDAQLEKVV